MNYSVFIWAIIKHPQPTTSHSHIQRRKTPLIGFIIISLLHKSQHQLIHNTRLLSVSYSLYTSTQSSTMSVESTTNTTTEEVTTAPVENKTEAPAEETTAPPAEEKSDVSIVIVFVYLLSSIVPLMLVCLGSITSPIVTLIVPIQHPRLPRRPPKPSLLRPSHPPRERKPTSLPPPNQPPSNLPLKHLKRPPRKIPRRSLNPHQKQPKRRNVTRPNRILRMRTRRVPNRSKRLTNHPNLWL